MTATQFNGKNALGNPARLIVLVLWPIASASFLAFVAIYSIPTFDVVTNIVGLGGIAVGVIPFFLGGGPRQIAVRRAHDPPERPLLADICLGK